MGASVSSRGNDNSAKKLNLEKICDSEGQKINALLLKISENVSSMEKLVNEIDCYEDAEEFKNQLNEIQNHIVKLTRKAASDIRQLENVCNSDNITPHKQLQKRIQLQDEFTSAVKSFNSVQKLAAEKIITTVGRKKQEMKIETRIISALILIISEKVHSMKKITNQLCGLDTKKELNSEELLKELEQIDHYTDLLINDASDCIRKQAENLMATELTTPADQIQHTSVNGLSALHDIDQLLMSVQSLDDEKKNLMTKVNEFKAITGHKKGEHRLI